MVRVRETAIGAASCGRVKAYADVIVELSGECGNCFQIKFKEAEVREKDSAGDQ